MKATTFFSLLLCAFLFLAPAARAQTGSIVGTVTDSLTGEPLPGANVVLMDTQQGAATDAEGHYEISGLAPGTYTVAATYIGYANKVIEDVQVTAGEATEVNFALSSSAVALEEVVAIGYGVQRQGEVTSSISSVDVEEAAVGITSSAQSLMQGKAAGVRVIQSNGEPGGGMVVRIRGNTSISASNTPLYVVDGMPISGGSTPGGVGVTSGSTQNPLSFLNPNDIQSLNILKGAAATAIYGARGANGVVLITTKSGQAGNLRISYDGAMSVGTMANQLDLLSADEYRQFVQEQVQEGNLDESVLEALGNASTDWQDAITRTAISQSHSLAISGGTEQAQFRASLGYSNEEGIILSSAQSRLSARLNMDAQALDNRLDLGLNVTTGLIRDNNLPYQQTAGFQGALFASVLTFNPTYPIREENGDFYEYSNSTRNPVALAKQIDDLSKTNRTRGNLTAELDIVGGLSAQVNVGAEHSRGVRRIYFPSTSPIGDDVGGEAFQRYSELTSKFIELTANYTNTFGRHFISAVAGYSWQNWIDEGFGTHASNFITDYWRWNNLGGGGNASLIPYSYKSSHKLISLFGRINYDYDGRYLFSVSLRRDGSSRFGANHKWGLFPAASAAWRLSRDIDLPDFITSLKLRAGYGQTGNEAIGNYLALKTLAPGYRAVWGQQPIVGVAPNQVVNPDLQWEETATYNVGLDYGLLDGRLSGSIDYYVENTQNLLVTLPVLQPAVVTTRVENIGKIRNSGFEFSMNALLVDQEDLTVSLNGNFSTNHNEVVSLGGRQRIILGDVSGAGLTGVQAQLIREGLPLGTFYGPVFLGVNDAGQQVFKDYNDTNGDGIGDELVGETTRPGPEDRQVIGYAQPNFYYGLTGSVNWKQWDLTVFLRGVQGAQVLNNTALTFTAKNLVNNRKNFFADALTDGTGIKEAPVYSSRWIENGSFLRLDYVTLGYTIEGIPQVERARVYVRGGNLFVITPYSGYDPEVQTDAADLPAPGIDYTNYPRARTFTMGVGLTF